MNEESDARPGSVLLRLTLLVEPDRQRLSRFVLLTVETLGGNVFQAAARLQEHLRALRADGARAGLPVCVALRLEGRALALCWGRRRGALVCLPACPPAAVVEELCRQLKLASETSDPDLLRRRNEEINHELDRYVQAAGERMREMEQALRLKQAELRDSIRRAETDCLTGLLNRNAYEQRLHEAVRRCRRQGEPLTLILFDLDNFKRVNDSRGHQYGDAHLRRMASAMQAAVRTDVDQVCRIGGDEFAVMVHAPVDVAARIAESVLAAMDGQVSIGIASLGTDETPDGLTARADGALYGAKRGGRGQIRTAGDVAVVNLQAQGP